MISFQITCIQRFLYTHRQDRQFVTYSIHVFSCRRAHYIPRPDHHLYFFFYFMYDEYNKF